MYKKLTDQKVKNLTNTIETGKEFIISHIGDGEYVANIFGNIYSSYWQALKKAREVEGENIAVYYEEETKNYCICYSRMEEYNSYLGIPIIARLTLERINQKFNSGL